MITIQSNSVIQNCYGNSNICENKTNVFTQVVDIKSQKTEDIQFENQEDIDVKDASFKEVVKVADKLLDSGEISKGEYAKMVFDYSILERHIQQSNLRSHNQVSLVTQNNPMFEGYDDKKHNWIKVFEKKANQQLSLGNRTGYNTYIKIKSALESLENREDTTS